MITGSGDSVSERLADSLRTALDISEGIVVVDLFDEDKQKDSLLFSEKFACPVSGFSLGEIEPRLFSFNTPLEQVKRAMVLVEKINLMKA